MFRVVKLFLVKFLMRYFNCHKAIFFCQNLRSSCPSRWSFDHNLPRHSSQEYGFTSKKMLSNRGPVLRKIFSFDIKRCSYVMGDVMLQFCLKTFRISREWMNPSCCYRSVWKVLAGPVCKQAWLLRVQSAFDVAPQNGLLGGDVRLATGSSAPIQTPPRLTMPSLLERFCPCSFVASCSQTRGNNIDLNQQRFTALSNHPGMLILSTDICFLY